MTLEPSKIEFSSFQQETKQSLLYSDQGPVNSTGPAKETFEKVSTTGSDMSRISDGD